MTTPPNDPAAIATGATDAAPPSRRKALRRFLANRMAVAGTITVLFLIVLAVFAPWIAPHHPNDDLFRGMRGVGPSLEHPMGFDHLSRDLLSRVIYGTRIALIVGLLATLISVVIGVIAGYFGGWIDEVLSLITDALMAFPLIALLIVLAAVLGPSVTTAARALGAFDARIIRRHVIPNVLTSVIVLASLGGILSDGRAFILCYPHIAVFPGLMIVTTVLAFNFIGDGLRDALDPHRKVGR